VSPSLAATARDCLKVSGLSSAATYATAGRTDAGHGHEHPTGGIGSHRHDETAVQRGALGARHLSRLKERHDDPSDLSLVRYQRADILFE